MSSKLYKIDKDTLVEISSTELEISGATALSIQHIHDATITSSENLPFNITILDKHVPYINQEEFMVVIRERIDVTARGPQETTLNNLGDDIGRENYNKKVPYRPLELPPGFQELKGNN